jgi:hypothetical protein
MNGLKKAKYWKNKSEKNKLRREKQKRECRDRKRVLNVWLNYPHCFIEVLNVGVRELRQDVCLTLQVSYHILLLYLGYVNDLDSHL